MTVPLAFRRPGLRLSLLASVAGNTLFALGGWLVLAALAKLTDAATVGRYVLALALTAPIFLFANLQLREVQATDHSDRLPFQSYLKARLVTSTLAFFACAVLAYLYDGPTCFAIILTAAAKALDAVVDMVYGLWLREERQTLVAASMALRGLTTILFVGAALLVTHSLAVACVVSLLQSALGLAHALYRASREGSPWSETRAGSGSNSGWKTVGEGVRNLPWLTLLPLGAAIALDSLAVNVPRYFVQAQLGLAKVGAFGAVCTFMQLGTATVVVGLTQVGLPRLSRLYAANDKAGYVRLLNRLLAVGLALGGVGLFASMVVGREMLTFAFGPSYAVYVRTLQVSMLAAIAWYASGILACAVTATRNFRVQLPVFAAGTAIVALAGLVLVPRFGLEGAAASIGLGFLVRALANGALVFRRV